MSTKPAWVRDFRKFLEFRAYQKMRRTPEILDSTIFHFLLKPLLKMKKLGQTNFPDIDFLFDKIRHFALFFYFGKMKKTRG
ncbi:MAG: hypothetical protein AB1465_06435 [Patescibacteria group bacterium]